MSDFEMCPIGTQARLAAIELVLDRAKQCAETEAKRADNAEAESRRLSDVVSLANRRSDHLGIRLGEVIAERDALLGVLRTIEATKRLAREMQQEWCPAAQWMVCMARAAIAKAGGDND